MADSHNLTVRAVPDFELLIELFEKMNLIFSALASVSEKAFLDLKAMDEDIKRQAQNEASR